MKIPEKYLQSEIRDGFYVSSKMKRTWAATIEVFKEVEEVCIKHGIEYYAEWGTLLGAVRHNGFIPWDDDFDISMKREDYMRFMDVARQELPDDYALLNVYNEPEYENLLTRVVNRKTISFGQEYMDKFHGFPYIVGIDVFPLDYQPDDKALQNAQIESIRKAGMYAGYYEANDLKLGKYKGEIQAFCRKFNYQIVEGKYIRQQIYQLIDKIMSIYSIDDGSDLVSIPLVLRYGSRGIPMHYYEQCIKMPFEYIDINVPLLYDSMLEKKYGNYEKSVRNWNTHMYPVYLGIEEDVHKAGRTDIWPDFSLDKAANSIEEQLQKRKNIPCDVQKNKEIVFMPYRVESWMYMEPLWEKMQEDPSVRALIVPIPYYEKDNCGKLGELHYDIDIFSEYLPVIRFSEYDFVHNRPDCIVIQNPYDEYDVSLSVPPVFYSSVLKHYTDRLIYIPDFLLDEYSAADGRSIFNMNFFCTVPGVINADEVYVQSGNMRERYVEKLTCFAGDNTRDIWEDKIKIADWQIDGDTNLYVDESMIPSEWWGKILDEDGNAKKIILYYSSISKIAEAKEKYVDKLKENLRCFNNAKDSITVIWNLDSSIIAFLNKEDEKLRDDIIELVEQCESSENIILDIENAHIAIAICDAFYGDRGGVMHRFERTGRPIMIQNVDL